MDVNRCHCCENSHTISDPDRKRVFFVGFTLALPKMAFILLFYLVGPQNDSVFDVVYAVFIDLIHPYFSLRIFDGSHLHIILSIQLLKQALLLLLLDRLVYAGVFDIID